MRPLDVADLRSTSRPGYTLERCRGRWSDGRSRPVVSLALLLLVAGAGGHLFGQSWTQYGGDGRGQRYSEAGAIKAGNVTRLRQAWVAHTHALEGGRKWQERASFEATPILAGNRLYVSTPYDQVLALDPASGAELWRYDPHVADTERAIITSRGVSFWKDATGGVDRNCSERIFIGTLDARLIALDAASGRPCENFGEHGGVDLTRGIALSPDDQYQVTSAPTVVGDVVVTGSSIGDNHRVEEESGIVRGFDARSGRQLWSWDPIPWAKSAAMHTGGANAWTTIAADDARGIVYVPTSSPSPDFYGAFRPGDDRDADSLVALDVHTGQKLWSFQVVHHDLWDYDLAAEPMLFDYKGKTPAVMIATKMGTIFVLNRVTGEPLVPVTEMGVPRSTVDGEEASATQPRSAMPALTPDRLLATEAWGPTQSDQLFCRDKIAQLRNEGVFTPPSTQGTLLYPGSLGGVNWGSTAFDPRSGTMYVNVNRLPFLVRLSPRHASWWHDMVTLPLTSLLNEVRWSWLRDSRPYRWLLTAFYPDEGFQTSPEKTLEAAHFGKEFSPSLQTPYFTVRQPLLSPSGLPCSPPPWGVVAAVNLNAGTLEWEVPLGVTDARFPAAGSAGLGGPMATAGGLVFSAAGKDAHLRAFDAKDGRVLWTGALPVPAQATPMTYVYQGRQYVVIAAGGHGSFGTPQGDAVVAFALPEELPRSR